MQGKQHMNYKEFQVWLLGLSKSSFALFHVLMILVYADGRHPEV